MMHLTEIHNFPVGPEKLGVHLPVTAEENFLNATYRSIDDAAACKMEKLRIEEGIISPCALGCCHCCRFCILTNIAEAHALGQYVRREFSADQIDDLRKRTLQWHQWDNSRPGRHLPDDINTRIPNLSGYEPCCPLLVNGACLAYPVRPVVCRTHFVCSDPRLCSAANDPESTKEVPVVLTSIVAAADRFSKTIQDHIENAGFDFSRSIMLLPHWLAIEMRWEFALSP